MHYNSVILQIILMGKFLIAFLALELLRDAALVFQMPIKMSLMLILAAAIIRTIQRVHNIVKLWPIIHSDRRRLYVRLQEYEMSSVPCGKNGNKILASQKGIRSRAHTHPYTHTQMQKKKEATTAKIRYCTGWRKNFPFPRHSVYTHPKLITQFVSN